MGRTMGFRRKTRRLFRKNPRKKGLAPLGRYLVDYEVGDYVDIIIDPSCHKAMPHYRFQGKTGRIIAKRGRCFEIQIRQMKKMKTLITSKDHIRLNQLYINSKAQ